MSSNEYMDILARLIAVAAEVEHLRLDEFMEQTRQKLAESPNACGNELVRRLSVAALLFQRAVNAALADHNSTDPGQMKSRLARMN